MSALISGRISLNTAVHLRVTTRDFVLLIDITGPRRTVHYELHNLGHQSDVLPETALGMTL
jgi:hypothetical protein